MQSLVYALGDVFTRAATFLLIPVYAHFLGLQGYGILAVTDLVYSLAFVTSFNSVASIVVRFYYDFDETPERRRFFGSLWSLLVLLAVLLVAILEFVGPSVFDVAFRDVPYQPYGRYAIWTGLLGIVTTVIPVNLLRARQRAGLYTVFNAALSLLKISLIVYLVVFCGEGVIGSLKGQLYAVVVIGVPCLVILLRNVRVSWSWEDICKIALFGLPLVPHFLAAWGLNLSDRVILNHYVSLEQLGVYTLGYQFGMLVNMLVGSVNSAWAPFFLTIVDDSAKHDAIPRLVTYIWGGIAVTGLGVVLLADPAIKMMTTSSFYASAQVVPWVAAGYVFLGLGIVPRNILLYQKRTQHVLLTTVVALMVNIGLNLVLVPRFGIAAAAMNTFIGFLVSLLVSLVLTIRTHIVSYETSRIVKILGVCLVVYVAGMSVSTPSPLLEALSRSVVMAAGVFLGLWVVRFYDVHELLAIKKVIALSRRIVLHA